MKFVAFLLLSSLTVALVLAFPDNHNAVADLPAAGLHDAAVVNTGTAAAATTSDTAQIRQPRHFLKKLFNTQPQVIVQPILVREQPYYGSGRGYNSGGNYNHGYGYNKRIGYW